MVFAWIVAGAATQVLPPSTLYCHSYDDRCPADTAVIFAVPETDPCLAAKARAARTAIFRTARPALWMIAAPSSVWRRPSPGHSRAAAGAAR